MNVNDGLGLHMGIRGLVGKRLPAASYARCQYNQNVLFCANGEESRGFRRLFSTRQLPNMFLVDAWRTHATYHRPRCEHCDTSVGRSLYLACFIQSS